MQAMNAIFCVSVAVPFLSVAVFCPFYCGGDVPLCFGILLLILNRRRGNGLAVFGVFLSFCFFLFFVESVLSLRLRTVMVVLEGADSLRIEAHCVVVWLLCVLRAFAACDCGFVFGNILWVCFSVQCGSSCLFSAVCVVVLWGSAWAGSRVVGQWVRVRGGKLNGHICCWCFAFWNGGI